MEEDEFFPESDAIEKLEGIFSPQVYRTGPRDTGENINRMRLLLDLDLVGYWLNRGILDTELICNFFIRGLGFWLFC